MLPINIGYGSTSNNVTQAQTTRLANEVLVTERGVLNTTNRNFNVTMGTFVNTWTPTIASNLEKVEIIRNLIDDTYNLKVYRTTGTNDHTESIDEFPSVGVNNKVSVLGRNSPVASQINPEALTSDPAWNINHEFIENIHFRDTTILGVGADYCSSTIQPIFQYVLSPMFETLQTNVDLRFDQVLHIATLKKITLQQGSSNRVAIKVDQSLHSDSAVPVNNDSFTAKLEYNHIYIKPEPLDRYHGNEVIAKVYIKNDGNMPTTFDHSLTKGVMKSSGLGTKTAGIYFENDEQVGTSFETTGAHYLGSIKSLDSLYYDYENDRVELGSSSDSIYGDIVPYNFSGDYTREINIPINAVFNDLNIRFHTNVPTAILDASEGQVGLSVSNDKSPIPPNQIPHQYFDMDDIKIIREHQPSLNGLERMLNE